MDMENMTNEEFQKQLEEFVREWNEYHGITQAESDAQWQEDEDLAGNPYGAGFYTFIRSAEDSAWMMMGDEARFDSASNTWFEYMGCGYACERDGIGLQEADEIDMYHFHKEHPQMKCRETFFDLVYGRTRDEVALGLFVLTEYDGAKSRSFSFDLKDVTLAQAKEYVALVEAWHATGELCLGPLKCNPCQGPWHE
jgi:hypothetical protein